MRSDSSFSLRNRQPPYPGELFSSWLTRLGYAHGSILQTFTNGIWPGQQIWNRDIDVKTPQNLIDDLAEMCELPQTEIVATTLRGLNGIVFEDASGLSRTPHVLPIGIYHRIRTRPGLQWCPECMMCDETPYWRLNWRLDFITCCTRHGIILADRCSTCGEPASPHRDRLPKCHICGTWFAEHPQQSAHSRVLQLQYLLESILADNSYARFDMVVGTSHPLVFFRYIRLFQRMLVTNPRSKRLCKAIDLHNSLKLPEIPMKNIRQFECLGVNARHLTMLRLSYLLTGWPWMFIGYCQESRFYWSWITKDKDNTTIPQKLIYWAQEFCAGEPVVKTIKHRSGAH